MEGPGVVGVPLESIIVFECTGMETLSLVQYALRALARFQGDIVVDAMEVSEFTSVPEKGRSDACEHLT